MNNQKFTKIVATLGPASDSKEVIEKLYQAGMNVARLNFSHGEYSYFTNLIQIIRSVSPEIAILLDTKGPEVRTGKVENDELPLTTDQTLTLTNQEVLGNEDILQIKYEHLNRINVGDFVLIDDGLIETEVIEKDEDNLIVKVLNDGLLGNNKTVSVHGHNVEIPFLSTKDKEDIKFGIEQGVDFIAASFVRTPSELDELNQYIKDLGGEAKVISKIEHPEAVDNIIDIIDKSYGIMVARGDLGVEIPLEQVPDVQYQIIKLCNQVGKPVIVATQMLESMKSNPRPTRAEVSDVAQAILEGADAVMLSGETASGKYPEKAVATMATIAHTYDTKTKNRVTQDSEIDYDTIKHPISTFVTKSAYHAAKSLNTSAILVPTESGFSARQVSRFKPHCPIYALTPNQHTLRILQLSWGVFPMLNQEDHASSRAMKAAFVKRCFDQSLIKLEDKVVLTSGYIYKEAGHTNILEIYEVKNALEGMN
ncbi:MAG: pyruvate kinase [Patescibacteria group bacterium]